MEVLVSLAVGLFVCLLGRVAVAIALPVVVVRFQRRSSTGGDAAPSRPSVAIKGAHACTWLGFCFGVVTKANNDYRLVTVAAGVLSATAIVLLAVSWVRMILSDRLGATVLLLPNLWVFGNSVAFLPVAFRV